MFSKPPVQEKTLGVRLVEELKKSIKEKRACCNMDVSRSNDQRGRDWTGAMFSKPPVQEKTLGVRLVEELKKSIKEKRACCNMLLLSSSCFTFTASVSRFTLRKRSSFSLSVLIHKIS